MDFAFVPNKALDDFNQKIFETLQLRPNTTMVKRADAKNVEELINFLNDDPSVSRPIGNILIGSHAADKGWISVQFTGRAINGSFQTRTEYSTLEFAETNSIGRIKPATVQLPSTIFIKGCVIGQAKPFVEKLKAVFGGQVNIHAPVFFERLAYLKKTGYVESFAYDFVVTSLKPFKDRSAIISAFQARTPKFQFLDGTDVPDKMWKTWLPPKTDRKTTDDHTPSKIPVKLVPPIKLNAKEEWGSHEGEDPHGFTHRQDTLVFSVKNWTGTLPAATDIPGKIAFLKPLMAADPLYAHPKFPMHMRWEFKTLDDFLAGFNWELSAVPKGLNAVGTRFFVRILVPVCEPSSTNNLKYNFYPEAGAIAPAHNGIPDNDARFFFIV